VPRSYFDSAKTASLAAPLGTERIIGCQRTFTLTLINCITARESVDARGGH
jgi:hypothetical protein